MRIGVLSDTHSLLIPQKLIADFKNVDLIIHAGDICDADVLKQLAALAPVKAVCGNMDDATLRRKLPLMETIDVDGVKIGVAHGHQGEGRDAFLNVQGLFKDSGVDIVIFGHSHQALSQQIGSTLYFNPGSPNDVVKAKFFSYGIIEINQGKINANIVKL